MGIRPSLATLSLAALLGACTADTFTGQDAGPDGATIEGGKDASAVDAVAEDVPDPGDGETGDAAPLTYCQVHSSATFCDDYDDANETTPWAKWSLTTPPAPQAVMGFDSVGLSGKGILVKPAVSVGAVAYETKQIQGPQAHTLAFDIKFPSPNASVTIVRVQAQVSTFAVTTDPLGNNFILTGDSGSKGTYGPADQVWHHFDVTFGSGQAVISEDNGAFKGAVVFSSNGATTTSLDFGIIVSATGGAVTFDNVRVN